MPDVASLSTLAAKGFDAKDAVTVLLRSRRSIAEMLDRLEEAVAFEKEAFALGGRTSDCVALFNQNIALLQEQKTTLIEEGKTGVINSLKRGGLIAFGFACPVAPNAEPRPMNPRLWQFLKLDFETSSARGGGQEYIGIRMVKSDDLTEAEIDAVVAEFRGDRPAASDEPQAPSHPGRPSVMKAVKEKMKARAASGELLGSLSAESAYLEEWADSEFPGQQTPKAKSIRNALAAMYRALRRGEGPGN